MANKGNREIKMEGIFYLQLKENESFVEGMKRLDKILDENGIIKFDGNNYEEQEI